MSATSAQNKNAENKTRPPPKDAAEKEICAEGAKNIAANEQADAEEARGLLQVETEENLVGFRAGSNVDPGDATLSRSYSSGSNRSPTPEPGAEGRQKTGVLCMCMCALSFRRHPTISSVIPVEDTRAILPRRPPMM